MPLTFMVYFSVDDFLFHVLTGKKFRKNTLLLENNDQYYNKGVFSISTWFVVPSGNQTWQWKNGTCTSDFPTKTFIDRGFSSAMFLPEGTQKMDGCPKNFRMPSRHMESFLGCPNQPDESPREICDS